MLEGNVRNNLKKLHINNVSIPICNKPLAIQSKPRFLILVKNQKNVAKNRNNKIRFIIISLIKDPLASNSNTQ